MDRLVVDVRWCDPDPLLNGKAARQRNDASEQRQSTPRNKVRVHEYKSETGKRSADDKARVVRHSKIDTFLVSRVNSARRQVKAPASIANGLKN